MRRDLRRAGRLLVLPTVAFAALAAFVPGRLELTARVYALVVAGVVLLLGLGALRRSYPATTSLRGPAATRARPSRRPPGSLASLEQHALLGVASAFDLHHRLRPHLREIASGLLAARRRASLDAAPAESQRVLGGETWELVRVDRPRPEDRMARGIAPSHLRRVVESLERI